MKWLTVSLLVVLGLVLPAADSSAEEEFDAPAFTTRTSFFVKKGDRIRITARGRWKMGGFIGSCGPDGFPAGQYESYNLTSIATHGALIGKIGNSVWHNIGSGATITANRDGYLTLGPNDNEQGNNAGSLRVTISINED